MDYFGYDLEDAQIRQLINDQHVVAEEKVGVGSTATLTVICIRCGTQWPCQQVLDLRAWVVAHP